MPNFIPNHNSEMIYLGHMPGAVVVPDFYMKKLAAPPAARGKVDINKSATENLQILSQCLDRAIEDLVANEVTAPGRVQR